MNTKTHRYITDASIPGHAVHRTPTQYPDTCYKARTQKAQTYDTRRHTRTGTRAPKHTTHPYPGRITHDTALHAQHRFPPHNARRTASSSQTRASTHASPAPASKLPQTRGHAETKARAHTGSSAGRDLTCAPPGWDPGSARPPLPPSWSAGVPTLPISFPRLYTRPELGSRRKTETSGQQLRRRRRRGRGSIPPWGPGWRTGAASGATTTHSAAPGAGRYWDASYWPRGEGWSPDAPGGRCGRGRARGGLWASGDAGLAGVPETRTALASCT